MIPPDDATTVNVTTGNSKVNDMEVDFVFRMMKKMKYDVNNDNPIPIHHNTYANIG